MARFGACGRAKYRPGLYDDERNRPRPTSSRATHAGIRFGRPYGHPRLAALGAREIKEMLSGLIFGLDDPGVRIEAYFFGDAVLHRLFRHRLASRSLECARWAAVVVDGLRGGRIQLAVPLRRSQP